MNRFLPRYTAFALAGLAMTLAGCAPNTLPPPEGSAQAGSPTTGGRLSGTPEPALATPDTGAANDTTVYECRDGSRISARYPDTDTAVVRYDDDTLPMQIALSASGARYVGAGYEWWTKGSGPDATATLYRHNGSTGTGDVITTCRESN